MAIDGFSEKLSCFFVAPVVWGVASSNIDDAKAEHLGNLFVVAYMASLQARCCITTVSSQLICIILGQPRPDI